ncbi:MAG: YCF48-related protein [Marinagarivorans sp.]|nr:YCF48-related protein [Marinagarivorans sp.]
MRNTIFSAKSLFGNNLQRLSLFIPVVIFCVIGVLAGCSERPNNSPKNDDGSAIKKSASGSPSFALAAPQGYTLNPNFLTALAGTKQIVIAGTDGTLLGLGSDTQKGVIAQPQGVSQQFYALAKNTAGDKWLASGDKGMLLSSRDGGQQWQVLASQTQDTLVSVTFNPALNHWAVLSNRGLVLLINDDFSEIKNATVPAAETQKIAYSNATQKLLVLTAQGKLLSSPDGNTWATDAALDKGSLNSVITTPQNTELILTSEGAILRRHKGSEWEPITLNEGAYLNGSIVDVKHNSVIIFTANGDVFTSFDEGENWQLTAQFGLYINQGLFIQKTALNVVVGAEGLLATSRDGGKTWLKNTTLTNTDIEGLAANDHQVIAYGKGGLLLQSTDAGVQWQVLQAAITPFVQDVIATRAKNTLVAIGSQGLLQQSTNGGRTWRSVNSDITKNDYLFHIIDDANSQSLIAAGPPGTIIQSTDNGANWLTRLRLDDPSVGYFHNVLNNNKGLLVAIAGPGINHYSSDGGKTWQACTMDAQKQLFHGSYNAAHDVFIAAGQEGLLQKSTDGIHWDIVDIQTTLNFQTTFSLDKRIFVAGQGGAIIYSDNGGVNWQQGVTPTSGNIQHIAATPAGTLIATGLKGLMLRSTDNGAHWQPIYSTIQGNLRELFVAANRQGLYVTSRNGEVLYSNDDGKQWITLPPITSSSIKGLTANPDTHEIVAFGERLSVFALPNEL